MTKEDVDRALGSPQAVQPSELHPGWTEWVYREPQMRVDFDERNMVWAVQTSAPEARLPGGIGVGSTERQITRALPAVRCRPVEEPDGHSDRRVCTDIHTAPGFLEFTLIDGRVDHMTVARGLAQ